MKLTKIVYLFLGVAASTVYARSLLIFAILRDQFTRLRDGDRFWFESYLPPSMVAQVRKQTLAKIIHRNTRIAGELQDDVFHVPATR